MTMMILNVTLIIEQRFQWVERRRNDEAMQPFTSQCRKMVRHSKCCKIFEVCLTILRHCEAKG